MHWQDLMWVAIGVAGSYMNFVFTTVTLDYHRKRQWTWHDVLAATVCHGIATAMIVVAVVQLTV